MKLRYAYPIALLTVWTGLVVEVQAQDDPAEPVTEEPAAEHPTFYTRGRDLLDRRGRPVVLRGVNKMSVYDSSDPTGSVYLPEIRSTGANSIRIVWKMHDYAGQETSLTTLDELISGAQAQQLIPMVELHDTNDFADLPALVAYWTRPEVVALVAKHQGYLLLNIGNEVGDANVGAAEYLSGYTEAVVALRSAGILTPLVLDAPDYGKNLDVLDATALSLVAADPLQNLVFSVHLYWSIACGADAAYIRSHLEASVGLGYPLIIGEFSKYGGWPCGGVGTSLCQPAAEVDYRTILEVCAEQNIGWLVWEWGPGNAYNDPACAVMDLTSGGLASQLQPGWAEEVVSSSVYSIANTSVVVDGL